MVVISDDLPCDERDDHDDDEHETKRQFDEIQTGENDKIDDLFEILNIHVDFIVDYDFIERN